MREDDETGPQVAQGIEPIRLHTRATPVLDTGRLGSSASTVLTEFLSSLSLRDINTFGLLPSSVAALVPPHDLCAPSRSTLFAIALRRNLTGHLIVHPCLTRRRRRSSARKSGTTEGGFRKTEYPRTPRTGGFSRVLSIPLIYVYCWRQCRSFVPQGLSNC